MARRPRPSPGAVLDVTGPYDVEADTPDLTGLVDFGGIQVPVPDGGTLSGEPAPGGRLQAVHVALPGGRLSVSALAAPKSSPLWPDLAGEIEASLRAGGARLRSFTGPWGRELHAVSGGATSRFVGVDGPRWMLYGVATGPTATATELDAELRRMVARTVVVRGRAPYPVRTVLPLEVPEHLAAQFAAAADAVEELANTQAVAVKAAEKAVARAAVPRATVGSEGSPGAEPARGAEQPPEQPSERRAERPAVPPAVQPDAAATVPIPAAAVAGTLEAAGPLWADPVRRIADADGTPADVWAPDDGDLAQPGVVEEEPDLSSVPTEPWWPAVGERAPDPGPATVRLPPIADAGTAPDRPAQHRDPVNGAERPSPTRRRRAAADGSPAPAPAGPRRHRRAAADPDETALIVGLDLRGDPPGTGELPRRHRRAAGDPAGAGEPEVGEVRRRRRRAAENDAVPGERVAGVADGASEAPRRRRAAVEDGAIAAGQPEVVTEVGSAAPRRRRRAADDSVGTGAVAADAAPATPLADPGSGEPRRRRRAADDGEAALGAAPAIPRRHRRAADDGAGADQAGHGDPTRTGTSGEPPRRRRRAAEDTVDDPLEAPRRPRRHAADDSAAGLSAGGGGAGAPRNGSRHAASTGHGEPTMEWPPAEWPHAAEYRPVEAAELLRREGHRAGVRRHRRAVEEPAVAPSDVTGPYPAHAPHGPADPAADKALLRPVQPRTPGRHHRPDQD